MKIFPLSEGTFTVDKSKEFIPFNKGTDMLTDRPKGSLLVEIQPFAVVMNNDIVVIDTGLGYKVDGELQIHSNLKKAGIEPGDVTKVLISHLHKDHAGGISYENNGQNELTFRNAQYYVSAKEYEYASNHKSLSYNTDHFEYLHNSGKMNLLSDSGSITNGITHEISGGHSPYHTVFRLSENNEIVFFGGDVAPQHQQMKNRFMAKYDFDGRRSMELREQWWAQGKAEHWTFLFYHDIKVPSIVA